MKIEVVHEYWDKEGVSQEKFRIFEGDEMSFGHNDKNMLEIWKNQVRVAMFASGSWEWVRVVE